MWNGCNCCDPDYGTLIAEVEKCVREWAEMKLEFASTQEAFEALKQYVNEYFKNLDVQTEINNKLDEMYAAGQLDGFFGNTKYSVITDPIPDPAPLHSAFNRIHSMDIDGFSVSNYELDEEAKTMKEETQGVRVATFNLGAYETGRYPYDPNRDLLHKYISLSKAAIIGTQEMQTIYNVPAELVYSDRVRKHVYARPRHDYALNNFGEGFISMNEISTPEVHAFTRQPSNAGREGDLGYIHANITVGTKVLSVYNVHMWYKAMDNYTEFSVWKANRDELLKAMQDDPNPYIICTGDFNIRQNQPETIGSTGLKAFTDAGFKLVNGKKYGTLWGSWAVDDIIVSPAINIKDSGMVDCYTRTGGIDHNILWADIVLK